MKYEIKNRFTGDVQFVAKIEANEDTGTSVKIGLSVKWAIENNVVLSGADLSGANLYRADLSCADMSGTNLYRANLSRANLSCANLSGTDLSRANLYRADLSGADMSGTNLSCANLSGADLSRANLSGTNLSGADLSGADLDRANLSCANLSGADLSRAIGNRSTMKTLQIETYSVVYTSEVIQIGCQKHTHEEWRNMSDREIIKMDGRTSAEWWKKWKEWLFKTIEMSPAEPTGYVAKEIQQ